VGHTDQYRLAPGQAQPAIRFQKAKTPLQRSFSIVSVRAATFGTSLESLGGVVIVMHSDGPEEMEITLINCQADKSDEAACHHIP